MSRLSGFASPDWHHLTGTAEGFGRTDITFEALERRDQRITLWSVADELWLTAALRHGWDATRQLPDDVDIDAVVTALMAGDFERRDVDPPKPSLFAGLLSKNAPEPDGGVELSAAGLTLTEWPITRTGGVFRIVSPTRGTGS